MTTGISMTVTGTGTVTGRGRNFSGAGAGAGNSKNGRLRQPWTILFARFGKYIHSTQNQQAVQTFILRSFKK